MRRVLARLFASQPREYVLGFGFVSLPGALSAPVPLTDRAGGLGKGQPARKRQRGGGGDHVINTAKVGNGALFHTSGDRE